MKIYFVYFMYFMSTIFFIYYLIIAIKKPIKLEDLKIKDFDSGKETGMMGAVKSIIFFMGIIGVYFFNGFPRF